MLIIIIITILFTLIASALFFSVTLDAIRHGDTAWVIGTSLLSGFIIGVGIIVGMAMNSDVQRTHECESKGGEYVETRCVPSDHFIELEN